MFELAIMLSMFVVSYSVSLIFRLNTVGVLAINNAKPDSVALACVLKLYTLLLIVFEVGSLKLLTARCKA